MRVRCISEFNGFLFPFLRFSIQDSHYLWPDDGDVDEKKMRKDHFREDRGDRYVSFDLVFKSFIIVLASGIGLC